MKASHMLTILLSTVVTGAGAQVNNNVNLSPGNAAMGVNYPMATPIPGHPTIQPQLNIYSTSGNAAVGGEAYINCRREVQNGNGDFFEIHNATGGLPPIPAGFNQSSFIPTLTGSAFTHRNAALLLISNVDGAQDVVNTFPLMDFAATRGYARLQAGPQNVQSRPLFGWRNNTVTHMLMQANGNLGIGTGTTAATARLHTNGTVRHQNLPLGTGNVLTIDAQGNILNTNTPFNPNPGIQNSCVTTNIIPKVVNANGDLVCSQIFDDGGSVGINTTGPFGYAGGGAWVAGAPLPQIVRLDVAGLTRSVSFAATSDARYKTNVEELSNSLENVMKLNPVSYNWDVARFADRGFDNLEHTGFLAQELVEVLPTSVIKDQKGDYAVDYNSIIPVLTQAIQQQQAQIEDLKEQVQQLVSGKSTSANDLALSGVALYQNTPNPFGRETSIRYYLPSTINQAYISIFDLTGKKLRSYELTQRGEGSITVTNDDLTPGMYLYTLVVDGREADTKRMIVGE